MLLIVDNFYANYFNKHQIIITLAILVWETKVRFKNELKLAKIPFFKGMTKSKYEKSNTINEAIQCD